MESISLMRKQAAVVRLGSRRLLAFTVLTTLVCGLCVPVQAQTFAEWWNQKSTQKKYLLQQIAALQIYTGYLSKGYDIVKSGLGTVRNITNGEFGLHTAYINSLKQVNPVIRDDKRVAAILCADAEIMDRFKVLDASPLSADNQAYVNEVKQLVIGGWNKDLDELALVITAGKVQMTDDERLERLAKVYESTLDKAAFTQAFCTEVALMAGQMGLEQRSIKNLRRYYEGN
ncbi:hypothetical protein [Mucilaginibacter polytrichastri]|uniref:TerB family tellurite resistance protein n=1 Tax=Mucilaginibacter polytrichastri TaxID=1302689 RepID=A0A1Q5ZWJ8_9SPHI|nr:hypothetical protein [Mucilaginibacter polytrichastri]OKS86135.1 hypothetical protein RG47T_1585 [Mucilaginibacter polytrichastri]SFS58305.1 hypothetical protein SAMN04487890_1026 [Mucilaginibacter polytrichastri]